MRFPIKKKFCCCAAVTSPSIIWFGVFDHILSMFRLNDQIHKFLIKKSIELYIFISHTISRRHLLEIELPQTHANYFYLKRFVQREK